LPHGGKEEIFIFAPGAKVEGIRYNSIELNNLEIFEGVWPRRLL